MSAEHEPEPGPFALRCEGCGLVLNLRPDFVVDGPVWCLSHAPFRVVYGPYRSSPLRKHEPAPDRKPPIVPPPPPPRYPDDRLTPREARLMVALFGCVAIGFALRSIIEALVH